MPVRTLIIVLLAGSPRSPAAGGAESSSRPAHRLSPPPAPPATDVSPLDPGSIPDVPAQQQLQPPPRRRSFLDFLL